MADNRIPPLPIVRRRRAEEDAPAVGVGNWILRAGHRPLYVELDEAPQAADEDERS